MALTWKKYLNHSERHTDFYRLVLENEIKMRNDQNLITKQTVLQSEESHHQYSYLSRISFIEVVSGETLFGSQQDYLGTLPQAAPAKY